MSNTPKSSSRLESIDFLRGTAALGVVLYHSFRFGEDKIPHTWWLQALGFLTDFGNLGVPLFFVISGFCIHARWAKGYAGQGQTGLDFKDFWKRRVRRLYPPYFVILCIGMALMFVAYLHGRANLYPEPKLRWMTMDFIAHVFMLHGLHPVFDWGGGVPPAWTLAREEYLYLLYFPLLACRRTRGLAIGIGIVLIVGILFPIILRPIVPEPIFDPHNPAQINWWKIIHTSAIVLWIQWALGMVAVEAYYGIVKLPGWCRAWWMVIIWAALARFSGNYFMGPESNWQQGFGQITGPTPFLWGMTFFTLLNFCVAQEQAGRWPHYRLVQWLTGIGVFSYSLYLVHNPVVRIIMQIARPPAATATNPWIYLAYELMLAVCCVIAGKIFFWLVERHFLNTGSKSTKAVLVEPVPPAASSSVTKAVSAE